MTGLDPSQNVRLSSLLNRRPFIKDGELFFPLSYMRGGTSTGVLIWGPHIAPYEELREEIIRRVMGVPVSGELRGNRQITGLGRGPATSNKVFVIEAADGIHADFKSTLTQLAAEKSAIDWSVNCGNMSAAIPIFLLHHGLIRPGNPISEVRVLNTNTSVITDCRVRTPGGRPTIPADTEIPGVYGAFPGVELSLRSPVGAKTGKLLPTGRVRDTFDGIEVSCVDVAVPMVIMSARSMGLRGDEPVSSLNANEGLKSRLRSIWVQAGLSMRLQRNGVPMTPEELAGSDTIPKVCLISPPTQGGNISARYFTPQESHASLAVTGGCCLATACLIPGTTAHAIATGLEPLGSQESERVVSMENPAGILRARVFGRDDAQDSLAFPWVSYERNAQLFMDGFFQIYEPSEALVQKAHSLGDFVSH
jgi:2-methylaconitate cis-trans-isomerase PrpF